MGLIELYTIRLRNKMNSQNPFHSERQIDLSVRKKDISLIIQALTLSIIQYYVWDTTWEGQFILDGSISDDE